MHEQYSNSGRTGCKGCQAIVCVCVCGQSVRSRSPRPRRSCLASSAVRQWPSLWPASPSACWRSPSSSPAEDSASRLATSPLPATSLRVCRSIRLHVFPVFTHEQLRKLERRAVVSTCKLAPLGQPNVRPELTYPLTFWLRGFFISCVCLNNLQCEWCYFYFCLTV